MPSSVSYIIPKHNRPVWSPVLEPVDTEVGEWIEIPLYGYVTAGKPIEIAEQDEKITVPAGMVRKDSYALKVIGHSMIDDNIQDGDIIIIQKRETAENGESVVAMINNETVTLKKFYVEAEGVRLQPANPDMEPIILKHEELQILGIVTAVVRLT